MRHARHLLLYAVGYLGGVALMTWIVRLEDKRD